MSMVRDYNKNKSKGLNNNSKLPKTMKCFR